MSLLNRISSGLVVRDTFDSTTLQSIWQASPSDATRYSLTDKQGVLRLKHGEPDLFILMNTPRFDFVMEMDTDYDPIRATDQGGLVAYQNQDTRLELLEYYDPDKGLTKTYDSIRMVRRADLFEGYGTNDRGKTWELIGASFMQAPKVGMVLHGIQEGQSDTLDVKEFRVYRDTTLHVGNLLEGHRAELVDAAGVIINSDVCKADKDHVKVDVANQQFPLKARIRLFDKTNLLLGETELLEDIWGGDVYWYGMKLDLEIDGITLRGDREYQLGNMTEGAIEQLAYVVNSNDVDIPNVKATILAYSDYSGWEWVDLAPDVYGEPGTYKDIISLGTIRAGTRVPIWIKVIRQSHQQLASLNDYKFRIMFEGG